MKFCDKRLVCNVLDRIDGSQEGTSISLSSCTGKYITTHRARFRIIIAIPCVTRAELSSVIFREDRNDCANSEVYQVTSFDLSIGAPRIPDCANNSGRSANSTRDRTMEHDEEGKWVATDKSLDYNRRSPEFLGKFTSISRVNAIARGQVEVSHVEGKTDIEQHNYKFNINSNSGDNKTIQGALLHRYVCKYILST